MQQNYTEKAHWGGRCSRWCNGSSERESVVENRLSGNIKQVPYVSDVFNYFFSFCP